MPFAFSFSRAARLSALPGLLLLAACGSDAPPMPTSADSADAAGYKTTGTFACRNGAPGTAGVQVSSSADIPAGATTTIKVETPPGLPAWLTPDRVRVHCKVDTKWCEGTSCQGSPPVDFIGAHGDGLSWESSRGEDGQSKMVFTATVHNSDKSDAHHAEVILDLPKP